MQQIGVLLLLAALVVPAGGFYLGTTERSDYEALQVPPQAKKRILIALLIIPPVALLIFGLFWGTAFNICLAALVWIVGAIAETSQKSPEGRVHLSQARSDRLYAEVSSKRNASSFPTPNEFADEVFAELLQRKTKPLPLIEPIQFALKTTIKNIYARETLLNPPPPPTLSTSDIEWPEEVWRRTTIPAASVYDSKTTYRLKALDNPQSAVAAIRAAVIELLLPYLKSLPPAAYATEDNADPLFAIPLLDLYDNAATALQPIIQELLFPSQTSSMTLETLRSQAEYLNIAISGAGKIDAHHLALAQSRNGGPQNTYPEEAMRALSKTPLISLIDVQLPISLSLKDRFRHQWILGEHGAGKTTFISAMLEQDLKRVERGEASVFVMDSQNELIPDLARLKLFAPGQPLHGKLIYLEPDVDYPLHLNIFDFDEDRLRGLDNNQRAILARGSEEMVIFFMRSLVRSEVSGHMETILKYAFRAIKLIPDATVLTLADLLHKGGFSQYEKYLGRLDARSRTFLTKDMFGGQFASSLGGMQARLSGLTADDIFNAMFSQPRNTFDLFNELQSAKVIVINTKKALLRGATEPFGRFFIAKLLQASEERMMLDRDIRMPVFAYIDEASDYIAQEENISELIDKARKQKIGLIIANQREKQIESANVLDALSKAAIQARGRASPVEGDPPIWQVSVSGAAPIQVGVPNVNFRDYPKMSDGEYADMINEMRLRFSRPASRTHHPKDDDGTIIDAEYEEVEPRVGLPALHEDENSDAKFWQVWKK